MSEQPDLSAPSPADGPTTPGRAAVPREASTRREPVVAGRPSPPPIDRPTVPDRAGATSTPRGRLTPGRTRMSGTWVGVILGAVVLVFLLVFILQNLVPAQVTFLGLDATLPLGIWLLFAAIAGVLLLAIPGLGRMVQWRRAGRR